MVDQGDIETVEIDGEHVQAEVLGPALGEQFFEDVTETDSDATAVTQSSDEEIWVEPAYDTATWTRAEVEQLDDHNGWAIVNVGSGPHGPALLLRYEGDGDEGSTPDEFAEDLIV